MDALEREEQSGQEYIEWLISNTCMTDCLTLFELLHEIEFRFDNPYDENRAEEGINLRYIFTQSYFDSAGRNTEEREYYDSMMEYPCSVLEMLYALACSFEDAIMYDPNYGDRTVYWFKMFLDNLGLSAYDDALFSKLSARAKEAEICSIHDVLDVFMDRKYGPKGLGSLFPNKQARINLQDTEIWYQANAYAMDILGV